MLRAALIAALCALTLLPAAAEAQPDARAVIVLLPAKERSREVSREEAKKRPSGGFVILDRLEDRRELALGLLGATQGAYSRAQALLDWTQGTRTSQATYDPQDLEPLRVIPQGDSAVVDGWDNAVARADSAPADIVPGLLASSVPGGMGYAGVRGQESKNIEAMLAADRRGRVDEISVGERTTVAARGLSMLDDHRLVVISVDEFRTGGEQLDAVLAARRPQDLVMVIQTPPDFRSTQLLSTGVAGLGPPGGITSETTRREGLIAGIDVAPTVLDHLGIDVPSDMKGQLVAVSGTRDIDRLEALKKRFLGIGKRRIPALQAMVLGWLGVLFGMGAIGGWHATRRRGLRIGALAIFWLPVMVLVTAAIEPQRAFLEMLIIAAGCFPLAFLTDRLIPWPRGPLLPAAVAIPAYIIDLFRDSDLIVRSLLGPNPRFGSRYFGVGNELETALPLLMFIGLAAAMTRWPKSRRMAGVFAVAGLILGLVLGAGRLGADVGGVITVGAATTAAVLLALPRRPSRGILALAVLIPIGAIAALAAIDLATGGNGHFSRTVLEADSFGSLKDIVQRRYELALSSLLRGRMPAIALAAALAIVFAWRNRQWLYAPIRGMPAWPAGMLGGLAGCIVGSLTNDSGPLLLVIGVFVLSCVTFYIQGDPRLAADAEGERAVDQTRISEVVTETPAGAAPDGDGRTPERRPSPAPVT